MIIKGKSILIYVLMLLKLCILKTVMKGMIHFSTFILVQYHQRLVVQSLEPLHLRGSQLDGSVMSNG